jgi:hypothetical protein
MPASTLPVVAIQGGHNRLAGCLKRKTKLGAVCPLASDYIDELTDAELQQAMGKVDLEPYSLQLDQDGIGSCAAESSDESAMTMRIASGMPPVLFNPLFNYHTTSGGRDQGSMIEDNLAHIRDKGCCPESVWPRSKGFRATPPPEAYAAALNYRFLEFYDAANTRQLRSALACGFAIVFGANGHAVCGLKDLGDSPEIRNSWGPSWGRNGFGIWVPYNQIDFSYGAYIVRLVSPTGADAAPAIA